jgi:hypothetical protein
LTFTKQLLGNRDALSVVEGEMVRQAATLVLRAEQLQAAVVAGESVNHVELIRVTSDMRCAAPLSPTRKKVEPNRSPWRSLVGLINEAC